jgi:hypothetical protein
MAADSLLSYLFIEDFNYLWFVVIGLFFFLSVRMMIKITHETTLPSTKRLYLGYIVFFISLGGSRFLNLVANFYRGVDNPSFELFKRSSYVLGLVAFAFLVFGLERHFLKMIVDTKGIFTLIPLVIAVLAFILDYPTLRLINYAGAGIDMVMVASLYAYVASKSTGYVRRAAVDSIIGIIFIGIGFLLNSTFVDDLFSGFNITWGLNLLGACMNIAGALFIYKSTRQDKSAVAKNDDVQVSPKPLKGRQ